MCVMSHCTTHSFEIICRAWKVELADHTVHSDYKEQGLNPIRDVGFFKFMKHFLLTNFHIGKLSQTMIPSFVKITTKTSQCSIQMFLNLGKLKVFRIKILTKIVLPLHTPVLLDESGF